MNDIYEVLNHVDIDLSKYEDKPLNDMEVMKVKNRLKGKIKNKRGKGIRWTQRVAIIVGILTLSLVLIYKENPTFATNLPVVGNLIKNIIGEGNEEYDKYTQVINKTIEKNGFRVTLKEFNIDSIEARVAATFETDEILDKEKVITLNPKLYINGEWINCSGGGNKEVVDDHKYMTVDTLNISKAVNVIPEDMEVRLEYEEIMLKDKSVKGPWIFKFKASKKDVMTETKTYKIDKSFKLKNGDEVFLEEITITPLAMNLKYKSNGSELDFITSEVRDDSGNEVKITGGNSHSNGKEISGEELFNAPRKDVKKLNFKLEAKKLGEKDELLGKYDFEIDLSK